MRLRLAQRVRSDYIGKVVAAKGAATFNHYSFHALTLPVFAMQNIILVIHLLIAIVMIGLVLLQRSEGGALGIGGGGGGGFMTGRATANLLTRATAVLAALFFLTSMSLTLIGAKRTGPIVPQTPVTSGGPAKPGPVKPVGPSAPVK